MLDKIEELERRSMEIESLLSDLAVMSNQGEFRKLSKEHAELAPLVEVYRQHRKLLAEIRDNQFLLAESDPEIREMAGTELKELEERKSALEGEIRLLLLPKDPNDDKNVILELRAGTGGDESALFAGDLFRMYTRFADTNRWKVEIISASASERGGFKEIIASVEGQGVYAKLTGSSGFPRPRPRGGFIPAPAPWPSCPRPKSSTSTSTRRI
jgi:peptide chain release factor 1